MGRPDQAEAAARDPSSGDACAEHARSGNAGPGNTRARSDTGCDHASAGGNFGGEAGLTRGAHKKTVILSGVPGGRRRAGTQSKDL
jgi:hypothetical protein